jgi:hypothetical protein
MGIDFSVAAQSVQRLRKRLHNQDMLDLLDRWATCFERAPARLPTLADMRASDDAVSNQDRLCIEVLDHASCLSFRITEIGSSLARHLRGDLADRIITQADERVLGSLTRAYQRAARGSPHFDYARMVLGLSTELRFERLLLPITTNAQTVTHLLGIVTFEERTFY